jgi:uncharacterized OB-fold protein
VTTSPPFAKPPRLIPPADDNSRPYWTGGTDGRLLIQHCADCRQFVHPPRGRCPDCGCRLSATGVSGEGVVFTYTVSHQQFHPDVPTPFVIALVELVEQPGLRLVTNIVDCDPESVYSGMPVRVRFERHGAVFVPVFAPCAADAG